MAATCCGRCFSSDLVMLVDYHEGADTVELKMRHHVDQLVSFIDSHDPCAFVGKDVTDFDRVSPLFGLLFCLSVLFLI